MTTILKRWLVYCILFVVVAAVAAAYYWRANSKPLGEPRWLQFAEEGSSPTEQLKFLEGDFRIVKNVRALPKPVVDALIEEGGSRLTMVNAGQEFEATDVISNSSLPNRRLIFAGIADNRVFLHYEQGGIAHMFILALVRVNAEGKVEPVWRSYCGPVTDLQALRTEIRNGKCSDAVPREMR
jgi:hypothetical protein